MAGKSVFWRVLDESGATVDMYKETYYEWERELLNSPYKIEERVDRSTGFREVPATRAEFDEWVASREQPEYTDIIGREVKVGSRVAVAFALGRGAEIRVGKVVAFDVIQSREGGYNTYPVDGISGREQIVVEWEADNRRWGSDVKQSKIFAALRRYVVID